MSTAGVLACLAAGLQVLAYALYIRSSVLGRIRPNATSWLMWAYGTGLLAVVELDQDAGGCLLLLPAACALCSIAVALICRRRAGWTWPPAGSDRVALCLDLVLTAVYLGVLAAGGLGWLSEGDDWLAKALVLVCLNASTFVSYWPIVRGTYARPANEHWLPWAVWAAAYALLLVATLEEQGASWAGLQLALYPAISALLSVLIVCAACRAPALVLARPALVRSRIKRWTGLEL